MRTEKWIFENKKVYIERVLFQKSGDFSAKTTVHIYRLFEKFGFDEVFLEEVRLWNFLS